MGRPEFEKDSSWRWGADTIFSCVWYVKGKAKQTGWICQTADANRWSVDNACITAPRAGDIAVFTNHVAWVESVSGNNMTISQMGATTPGQTIYPYHEYNEANYNEYVSYGEKTMGWNLGASEYWGGTQELRGFSSNPNAGGGGGGGGGGGNWDYDTNSNWREEGYVSNTVKKWKNEYHKHVELINTQQKAFYRYWDYTLNNGEGGWTSWAENPPWTTEQQP